MSHEDQYSPVEVESDRWGLDPIPAADPLPAVSAGWAAEEDGNGTGPHQFAPPSGDADRAEPVQGDPEQAMRAVQQGQPGTWPTSPLDLAAGPPETPADTASPWPAAVADLIGPADPEPADPPVPDAAVTAFRATVKIDPIDDTGSFELIVAGSAALVSSIVEQFAQSFLFETQRAR